MITGGAEVMREQLQHLVELSNLSAVTLQVVPLDHGGHDLPNAPFFLFTFPDPQDPELMHIEYPTGSLQIENPNEVKTARLMFDRAQAAALSPADSVVLIERLAVELYGPGM